MSYAVTLAKLNEVFAPMDVEVLIQTKKWAAGRVQALREFRGSDEYQAIRRDQSKLYARMFSIAGGKTWYNIFNGRNLPMIEEFVEKNCAATVALRNAKIARKFEKAGVLEVLGEEYTRTSDGFNGVFIVKTDSDNKCVTINTIRAGGYNIQCAHLRVLVNVK